MQTSVPMTNAVEVRTGSRVEVEDRTLSCDEKRSQSPRSAHPCDVAEWESHVVMAYPRRALLEKASGPVRVYGIVDTKGKLTECAFTTTGNPYSLGRISCSRIEQFASFRVALDHLGKPVAEPVALVIRYALPDWSNLEKVALPVEPRDLEVWAARIARNYPSTPVRQDLSGEVGVQVLVDRLGRVLRCKVTKTSGKPITDRAACKGMERYARFYPAKDENGELALGLYATTITYRFD